MEKINFDSLEHIETVRARENFSDLVNCVNYKEKRIILTRRGKRMVAIVPLRDLINLQRKDNE